MEMVQKTKKDEKNVRLKYFKVEVQFDNEDESDGPFTIPDGIWHGLAKNVAAAQALAHDHCWDGRLDTTGCFPVYQTEQMPRYCSSEGWGHIFVGNREVTTRWIYDRGTKSLVAAQVLNGASWVNLDTGPMADLLKSIHDNDAADDADTFDLSEWDTAPTWKDVEFKTVEPNVSRPRMRGN